MKLSVDAIYVPVKLVVCADDQLVPPSQDTDNLTAEVYCLIGAKENKTPLLPPATDGVAVDAPVAPAVACTALATAKDNILLRV